MNKKKVIFIYNTLYKKHKYLAKRFFLAYKYPIQRKKEEKALSKNNLSWDVAISYSTDGDDPVFVNKCIKAKSKYIFVHQSTKIDTKNIRAMKKYNAVISVNPVLEPWISSMIKTSNNVYSIENYVDYERVKSLSKNDSCTPEENKIILATCGRLCLTKGYDYVVRTADILKKARVNFLWYWIGDGLDRPKMEAMLKEFGLEDEIVITGFQNNPYPYVSCCDIYVQPSRAEAYPLSIIEALTLGKIVISTKTKGGTYILNKYKCGFLVEESHNEIASKIMHIISDNIKYDEEQKVKSINWENEKMRYIYEWESLLSGNLDELKN